MYAAENGTAMESMRSNSRQYEEKIAEAESAAAALRSEVARLSTELLDKDTEYRNAAAARDRVELELQKLRVMEADVGTYKSAATAAREACWKEEASRSHAAHARAGHHGVPAGESSSSLSCWMAMPAWRKSSCPPGSSHAAIGHGKLPCRRRHSAPLW